VIRGDHTFIRGTEQDDVEALYQLYMSGEIRAGLLDVRREPLLPTRDDLRDLLTRKEIADGTFYTVEDCVGHIAGFCSLRGHNAESGFIEYILEFSDTDDYASPMALEAHAFLLERAFTRLRVRKVLAHAVSGEQALTAFLQSVGFHSAGIQREVVFAQGDWHHLETLVLHSADLAVTGD